MYKELNEVITLKNALDQQLGVSSTTMGRVLRKTNRVVSMTQLQRCIHLQRATNTMIVLVHTVALLFVRTIYQRLCYWRRKTSRRHVSIPQLATFAVEREKEEVCERARMYYMIQTRNQVDKSENYKQTQHATNWQHANMKFSSSIMQQHQ